MTTPIRVLLVEDNPGDARLVAENLRSSTTPAFALEWERTLAGGLRGLERAAPQVILLDMGLPDSSGLATLERVRAAAPALPIVLLTGLGDQETALQAIASGAQDYLAKNGLDEETLARSLRYAVERQRLENEFTHLAAFPRLTPEPLLEADAAGKLAYLNPAARALFPDLPTLGAAHPLLAGWAGVVERLLRPESPAPRGGAPAPLVRLVEVGARTYEQHISLMPDRRRFWASVNDVTERAAVDRLKREFAQNVCHELNTPLTCLYGSLQSLREDMAAEADPGRRALLDVALRGAQHLADMVNDLGDGAMAEAGTLRVEARSVDAGRLAAEAAAAFAGRGGPAAAAHVSADVPECLPPVLADPVRVRQVLNNLLGNARKFTPPGGQVLLRVRVDPDDPAFLRFSVRDEGCGIDAGDAPRVFERLFQAGRAKRGRKGLGIGLYLCRELVARQGGRIWLESRPGQGSTFSFTLPVYSLVRLLAPLAAEPQPRRLSLITAESALAPGGAASAPLLVDPRHVKAALREAGDVFRDELSPEDVLLPDLAPSGESRVLLIVTRRGHGSAGRLIRRLEAALARRAAEAAFKSVSWTFRSAALDLAAAAPRGGASAQADWAAEVAAAVERRLRSAPAGGWRTEDNGAMLGRQAQE